jgi:membrane dipeptidase
MGIFDLHSDVIHDIELKRTRGEKNVLDRYHYQLFKDAGITSVIMALWVEEEHLHSAFHRFIQLLSAVQADLAESKHFFLAKSMEDLQTAKPDKISVILGLEGLTFIEQWPFRFQDEDEQLQQIFSLLNSLYFKHAILAWCEINKIASGTGAKQSRPLGLSSFGKKVVKQLEKNHYIIDLSHLDEPSFWDVLKETSKPVICSHSNARSLCDDPRNLTDEQLIAIKDKDGLVGVTAVWEFIGPENPTLEGFMDHIDYIVKLIGIDHVVFGFDFTDYIKANDSDYKFTTIGLEGVSKVPKVIEKLYERGYSKNEIDAISYKNFLKYLTKI